MDELAPLGRDLARLWQDLDHAFDHFFRTLQLPDFGALAGGTWPEPEITTEGRELVVRLKVPGARPESLEATLTPEQVLVRGETRVERGYTCFARALPLPARVRPEGARTEQRDGYLVVRAPLA